jgi:hypothetical protein
MSLKIINTGGNGGLTISNTGGVGSFTLIQPPNTESTSSLYITSNWYTSSMGFTVGAAITKDMNLSSSLQTVPSQIIGDYIYPGTMTPPTSALQRWSDWQGDIFDGWGYFYLYDVDSNSYYIPVLNPVNTNDGVINTQTYTAFGSRTFTIKHGYPVQGVFKFDISVSDNKDFVFGAYGDMGSDTATVNTNLSSSYSLNGNSYNLYYNKNNQTGTTTEIFFTYVIPYETEKNTNVITYVKQNSGPGVNNGANEVYSFYTKNVKKGVTVYFSKTNDVRNWVVNDLKLSNL